MRSAEPLLQKTVVTDVDRLHEAPLGKTIFAADIAGCRLVVAVLRHMRHSSERSYVHLIESFVYVFWHCILK